MSDTLTNGQSPEASGAQQTQLNEDRVRQMVAAYEEDPTKPTETEVVPTVTVDANEPTTAEVLTEQYNQPAVSDEQRNASPTNPLDRVQNPAIIDKRAQSRTEEPSERLKSLYAAEEAGTLVYDKGQAPSVETDVQEKPKKKRTLFHPFGGGQQ